MPKLVYGLFDNEFGTLHMFAADSTILAKDVVMAFLEKEVMKDWEEDFLVEHKKDILTRISATASPEDLTVTLFGFGFILNILSV